MQGLCWLGLVGGKGGRGGLILLSYIYKQCNGMQGLCDQLTRGFNLPSIYIYIYNIYIYIYI